MDGLFRYQLLCIPAVVFSRLGEIAILIFLCKQVDLAMRKA